VGNWVTESIDSSYSWQVLVGDFDDDGHLDIFHGIDYGPIHMFYGDGAGNFVAGADVADPGTTSAARLIQEGSLDAGGQTIYEMNLTAADIARLGGELKFTLAWDDAPGDTTTPETTAKLVNDLDLYLIGPDGTIHLPWTLDPLPVANCGGAGPGCGDPDPISPSDVVPAHKAADHLNNVEMVQVSGATAGRWQIVVNAYRMPMPLQKYSLVGNIPIILTDGSGYESARWKEIGGSASGEGIKPGSGYLARPDMVISDEGIPYVALRVGDGQEAEIYVMQYYANDDRWKPYAGSKGNVSQNDTRSHKPAMALDNSGKPIVAWLDDQAGNWNIYVKKYTGTEWAPMAVGQLNVSLSNQAGNPAIAVTSAGIPIVAWTDLSTGNREIYVKMWNETSQRWEPMGVPDTLNVSNTTNSASFTPSIAIGSDDLPVVAWSESPGGAEDSEIYVKKWDGSAWVEISDGSATEGGVSDNVGGSWRPSLVIGPDGMTAIAWEDNSSGHYEIYFRQFIDSFWREMPGGSATQGGISRSNGDSYWPSLAIGAGGYPVVAWEDNSLGESISQVYVRGFDGSSWVEIPAGSATEGGISSGSGGHNYDYELPALATHKDGRFMVAYSAGEAKASYIYVKQYIKQDTTTTITSHTPNPSGVVLPVVVNYTVTAVSGTPTGTVIVSDGTDICTGTVAAGTCTLVPTTAGSKTLTATYTGDAAFNASSGTASHTVSGGTTTAKELLYLSYVVQNQSDLPGSGWTTGMQFQNVGVSVSDIQLLTYNSAGTEFNCGAKTAEPGGSVNYLMDNACPTPATFNGSGVTLSDEPTRGIVHVNNASVGEAGGIYTASTIDETAATLFFPLVKHNHFGRTTTLAIQNAGSNPIDLTATFRVLGKPYVKTYTNIPGRAKVVVTPADAGVPSGNGNVGSLTITATGPVAGASLEHQNSVAVAENLQAAKAFTPADYDNEVYCPLFRNAHTAAKLTTGAQVQNVSGATQTVTLTYTPRDGGLTVTSSQDVEAGASATFYAPFIGIPDGSVGSVTVTSTGYIVAVVNDEGKENGRQRTTTYACFPAKNVTTRVVMPLYKEFWLGNTSGIQIQNVGNADASIEITYIATNKAASVTFGPGSLVPAGGSTTFFGVSQGIFPPTMVTISGNPAILGTTYGSVVIESDMPIVAIANESGFGPNASTQDSKNYEGFNQ
jgi:hypothetical protein